MGYQIKQKLSKPQKIEVSSIQGTVDATNAYVLELSSPFGKADNNNIKYSLSLSIYLKDKTKNIGDYNFKLYLSESKEINSTSQYIGKFNFIEKDNITGVLDETFYRKEIIFTSSKNNYKCIIVEPQETNAYTDIDFKYYDLIQLSNMLLDLGSNERLVKFCVHGTPGSSFCLNNEKIYIGRTGIYELENTENVRINFFAPLSRFSTDVSGYDNRSWEKLNLLKVKKDRQNPDIIFDYIIYKKED